uniref:Putative voltage-dependent calcium channel 4 n=1 Tax=Hirudo verbana TaxID=311461 RepID=A0A2S1WM75_9ANNE|nr:putative voltage-dependent calcium channel 4 [Hirudo verbana]
MRRKSMVPQSGHFQEEAEPTIEIVKPTTGSDPQVQSPGEVNRGYLDELPVETQVTSPVPSLSSPGSPAQQNGVPPMAPQEYHYPDEGNRPVPILPYSSLFIFSSTNPARKFCHFFVNLRWFNWFIIVIILASCAELAMEDPVTFDSYYNFILSQFDYSFTAVFLAEVVLKVIDLGFVLHKGSYCRDLWNVLDLFIVVCAIAGIAFAGSSTNLDTVKSLRVLRVLRPLKTINRIKKLKAVFDGLVTAVKKVMLIMSLYLLFQIIFAIIAVQLFMGRFCYCTDLSMRTEENCKGEYIEYTGNSFEALNREWSRFDFNFDNIGASLLTLFVVQTRSGWPDILKNAMDSSQRDQGPILEYNNNMAIFFIVYFLVFPFFFVNLFVALIVVTFQEQGEKELEELNLDKNQRNCLEFVVNSNPVDCYMPNVKNRIRLRVWKAIISKPFDYLMFVLISLNTITLMMKFYNQPQWYDSLLSYANIFFTVAFTVEAVVKMFGYGIKNYFRQAWNVFDFITVLGSIVDVTVYYTVEGSMKTLGFLKLFRAMRLIKLLKQSASIRMLLWTFFQAVKALPYVLIIIGLLFFVYAVIGMQLFGTIGLDNSSSINRQANFQNFPNALLLLFRCSTLDNWDGVLVSCLSGQTCDTKSYPPGTNPPPTCGTEAAIVYFVSFNFITAFMMLNLFIAVIMDNFDYLTRDSSILGPHHLDSYIQKWGVYDPTASSYISYTDAYELLRELEPPVGFGKKCPWKLAYRKLIRMNMPINEYGKVHFKTTMFALIREALSIKVTNGEFVIVTPRSSSSSSSSLSSGQT